MPEPRKVTPIPKAVPHLTQRQRKAAWEREFQKARVVVKAREHGRCEFVEEGARCDRAGVNVHHMRGRVGEGANDPSVLRLFCVSHDEWVTNHPLEALERGYSLLRTTTAIDPHVEFHAATGVEEDHPDYVEMFDAWVDDMRAERAISNWEADREMGRR